METSIIVILWTAALFGAILVNFAVRPKYVTRLLGISALVTGIGGILIYGYGYARSLPDATALAVLKAVFAVCGIFVGRNSYGDISGIFTNNTFLEIIFWMLHIFGLFSSVGAAISTLGAKALRELRLMLPLQGDLAIVYGVTADTLSFAQQLLKKNKTSVVFIDDQPASGCSEAISAMGCVLRSDSEAMEASPRLISNLGVYTGKRNISLYALTPDPLKNQQYARSLCRSFAEKEIPPEQTSLTILSNEEETAYIFQATQSRYGYGSTISVDTAELAARLMIHQYPPCSQLTFDENGLAQQDFHAVVIGFGQMGQAVLRHLVMNGQFAGSTFKAAVFAPDHEQTGGYLRHNCQEMLQQYDITFYDQDGRSQQMFDYLTDHADTIQYIAICTGQEKMNAEIEQQIRQFLAALHSKPLICRCNHHQISRQTSPEEFQQHPIFSPAILCAQDLDRTAMVLNHTYCLDSGKTPYENWKSCDTFSRMSSRASADFAPAFLRAAGLTEEAILEGPWEPHGALLENLAITEHMRWCAFHYAMGFSPMDEETYARRADAYLTEKANTGTSRLRIGKDMEKKLHACLIPWEALDELSRKENAITGGHVDYKLYDRNNVLALGDVIRAAAKKD